MKSCAKGATFPKPKGEGNPTRGKLTGYEPSAKKLNTPNTPFPQKGPKQPGFPKKDWST